MGKRSKKKDESKEEIIMENKNVENNDVVLEDEIVENGGDLNESITDVDQIVPEDNENNLEVIETDENVEDNRVIGKITGFEKLYVRKNPDKDSEPVGIVGINDELGIDFDHSTDLFYKVITSNGLEGYCIKDFVKII